MDKYKRLYCYKEEGKDWELDTKPIEGEGIKFILHTTVVSLIRLFMKPHEEIQGIIEKQYEKGLNLYLDKGASKDLPADMG